MRFPFLSWSSHLETLKAKDETIAVLRETNTALLAALAQLTPQKGAASAEPAKAPRAKKPQPAIDLASLDPNDNEALARIALREIGGNCSMSLLQRKVEHIRRQVVQAQAQRREKQRQPVFVSDEPPASILSAIEEAISQGQADARTV